MSLLRREGGSIRWRAGIDVPALGLVGVAILALLSVVGLSWQTWRAWDTQRRGADQLRRNVAEIAARNFASRLRASVANEAARMIELMAGSTRTEDPRALPDAVALALRRCPCRFLDQVDALAVADSSGALLQTQPRHAAVHLPSSDRRVPEWALDRARATGEPVLWAREPGTLGAVHVLDRTIGVVLFKAQSLRNGIADWVSDSAGRLYPLALLRDTMQVARVVVQLEHQGTPLLTRAPAQTGAVSYSLPVTLDGSLMATVTVRPDLAVSAPQIPSWQAPLVGGLAIATALAVLASTVLATRSSQLARARADFAATVSHELRTPLTQIILFSELMERGHVEPASLPSTARLIRAEARRLHQMVENVLVVMRGDHRRPSLSSRPVALEPLVRDIVHGFAPIAQQSSATVASVIDPAHVALVDPTAVRQVLLNLLENAVRYGPEGQHIVIRSSSTAHGVAVDVDDQGPGIAPHDRQRVFEPWTRLDRSIGGRSAPGTGLGLTVVHHLVRAMRGSIEILDAPGGGARMRVTLPVGGSA